VSSVTRCNRALCFSELLNREESLETEKLLGNLASQGHLEKELHMEWTTLVWIALAAFMVFNIARGGGCCGGYRPKPNSGETKKTDQ
jgi:hypothetical protein